MRNELFVRPKLGVQTSPSRGAPIFVDLEAPSYELIWLVVEQRRA